MVVQLREDARMGALAEHRLESRFGGAQNYPASNVTTLGLGWVVPRDSPICDRRMSAANPGAAFGHPLGTR